MQNHVPPRIGFWTRRGLSVFSLVFALLLAVELLKGHELPAGVRFGLIWSAIATAVFLGTRIFYVSRGKNCPLCNDLPEQPSGQDGQGGRVG